jgi:serine/threonine protein kinase
VGPWLPRAIGRYTLFGEIASGGMATVHYGRLLGPAGFARTVAIKRLHAQFARDPEFAAMFLDEARLAARIRHPNVVQTLDVVALEGELFLVMDYVQGESLSRLARASIAKGGTSGGVARERIPLEVVSGILCGVLHGLHAAHEAKAESGEPLGIVHRDVSPQNVLVGADGVPRVLDFGVAKAAGRGVTTQEGQVKGKFAYMSPEQVRAGQVDRRTDVYASGVVLWEALTLRRLFAADNEAQLVHLVVAGKVTPPSAIVPDLPKALEDLTMRALSTDPAKRFPDAKEMALALEAAVPVASPMRVAAWVEGLAGEVLAERAKSVASIESHSNSGPHQALKDVLADSVTPTVTAAAPPSAPSGMKGGLAVTSPSAPSHKALSPPGRSRTLLLGVPLLCVVAGAAWMLGRTDPLPANASAAASPLASAPPSASSSASPPA